MLAFGLTGLIGIAALAVAAPARAVTALDDDRARAFSATPTGSGANRVAVADGPALALGPAFTIELWAKRSSTAANQVLLEKRNSYALAVRGGTLMYQVVAVSTGTQGIWLDTGVALPVGTWTHVALVKDGTTVRLVVDGVVAYTAVGTATADTGVSYGIPEAITANANALRIGADSGGAQPFGGLVDDVRIWGAARSAAQVDALKGIRLASDIGTWLFDEPGGSVAYNSAQATGSALNGAYQGTTPPAVSTDVPVAAAAIAIDDAPAFSANLPAYDPEGPVTFAITTDPTRGAVALTDAATGAFTFTPDLNADGADLLAYTATDADDEVAGPVDVAFQISDRSRPTVTAFTTTAGSFDRAAAQSYALTFSEPVTGIDAADFSNAGTAADCAFDPGADTGATRTLAVTGCGEGTLVPRLRAGAGTDAAGNTGPLAAEDGPAVTIDRTPPSVTSFTTAITGTTRATSIEYALALSEDVTGLAAGDFENTGTATGCAFDPGADAGDTRTVTVTGCSDGTLQPRLRADAATDPSGTTGPVSAFTVAAAVTLDRTAPTSTGSFGATATSDPALAVGYTAADAVAVQKVTAYYSTSLSLTMPMACGEVTSDATSGSVACLLPAVHPTDGSISTDGTYYVWTQATDTAGNVEAAPIGADVVVDLDRVPPTVTAFTTTATSPAAETTFTYSLSFSEPVTGVAPGDFTNHGTATGCAFAPGTDAGSTRTVTVTGCGTGTLIPRFAATEAADAAGNLGPATEADATPTVTIDRARPTLDPIAVAVDEGQTLTFSPSTFQEPFTDDRAVQPASITVRTLPTSGTLRFEGADVVVDQVLPYADLGGLTYVPEPYVNGTYDFTVTASDGANESTPATTVSITLRPVTTEPRLTRVDPLAGANEDQTFTITYQALLDASDAQAFDATLRFRIESILNGSVTKGGSAVVVGTTAIGPGEAFVWTPPADAYGLVAAFTVRAFDGTSISTSPIQVQAQVAAQVCPTTDSTAGGWIIRQITAVGQCTWVAPAGVTSVQALVVGGGGGGGTGLAGGYYTGGGGGAGGYVHDTSVAVSPGSSYRVTVGAGGAAGASGGGSAFGAVTVSGGGYGGQGASASGGTGYPGGTGGSGGGGGGGYSAAGAAGGTGTAGQGTNGSAGGTARNGGTGGGATGNPTGATSTFTGSSVVYATGGTGVANTTPPAVAANRGNGGPSSTAGGSGIVGIRWATATPTVSAIADQATSSNTTISGIAFTVADADNTAGQLTVTAASSNTTVVPNGNITIGGTNPNRTLTITPATGQSGAVTITVSVTDGATTGTRSFVLAVGDAVKPTSSVTFPSAFTTSTSLSLSFTASDVSGIANVKAYYATLANLSDAQQCASLNTSATSGTLTCAIPATQGTFYLFSRATDTVGNVEDAPGTADDSVVYDTVKPVSAMTTVTLETSNRTVGNVAITVTDAGQPASGIMQYSTSASMASPVQCGTWTSTAASLTSQTCTLPATDGRYHLASRATDAAGNQENQKTTPDDAIILDRVAPATTGTISATLTSNVAVPVAYSATDANTMASVTAHYSTSSALTSPVTCGTATSSATSGTVTCTLPSTSGTYYVYTRGTDLAGNVETAPGSADDSIVLDVTAPSAVTPDLEAASDTGSSSTDDYTRTTTPAFSVSGYEAGATLTVTASRSGAASVTCTATTSSCTLPTLSDGIWTVTATQTDPAGNVSAAGASLTVTVDNTGPVVTSFAYGTGVAGGVRYLLTFDETVTGLAVDDFSVAGTAAGWSVTAVSGSGAGPYQVTLSGSARGTVVPTVAAEAVENPVQLAGPASAQTAAGVTAREPWLDSALAITVEPSGSAQAPILTAVETGWVGVPGGTVTRRWQVSSDSGATWSNYPSATAATLTPTSGYNGRAFRVVSTYANTYGTAVAFSRGIVVRWFQGSATVQTWTVPTGTGPIAFDLLGGAGGEVATTQLGSESDSAGLGGRVRGTLTGLAGQSLSLLVGTVGNSGATTTSGMLSPRSGGYNGGGTSGGNCSSGSYYGAGAGGGGATDIRRGGTALANRILVAGGGGGDGINLSAGNGTDRSGHGGGLVGGSAWTGETGGTQSAGGTGYQNGSLGQGGSGYCFGGGGGGGYYGGGGGGTWGNAGGGSSYADAAHAPDAEHTQGASVATGNGLAVFSWELPLASTGVVSLEAVSGPTSGRTTQTFALGLTDAPTGLDGSDLAVTGVTGWTVTDVVGHGLGPYMVSVGPTGAETEGAMGLRLAAGAATVGGASAPTADVDARTTIAIDLTGPVAQSLVSTSQTPTNATTLTYTLTFDGTATGTAASEFSNAGTATGCAFAVAGSGATRTITVTSCSEGTLVPRFAPTASVDPYGNPATPATLDGTAIAIDRTPPAAVDAPDLDAASDSGQSASDDRTNDSTPTILISGIEDQASVVVSAARAGASTVTCTIARAAVTAGSGSCTLPVMSDGAWAVTAVQTDYAGTAAAASAALSVVVDTTRPTAAWTTTPGTLVTGTTATYVLTFSESVIDVAAADLSNASNATGCTFDPGADTGTTRTVVVSDCADGGLVARFAANGATDLAGNTGPTAAAQASVTTAMRSLYAFTSHTFTTCGASGASGPSLAACQSAYATTWDADSTLLGNSSGIQTWVVPETGTYEITVNGAAGAGGSTSIGGVRMQGRYDLTAGDVLKLAVGQMPGATLTTCAAAGGGGGGSFVATAANAAIMIAGGAGGKGYSTSGSAGQTGTSGAGGSYGGAGGTGGGAGGSSSGGGGGGLTGSASGTSFTAGATGGSGSGCSGGGFGGGGGGSTNYGGGGGGYSGGGGGGWYDAWPASPRYRYGGGGGGGSFAAAGVSRLAYLSTSSWLSSAGYQANHGSITIARARTLQTISFDPLPDLTYGEPAFDLAATASSGLALSYRSETSTICTVAGETVTLLRSGTCTIRAYSLGDGDWYPQDETRSFAIAKAALTVTASSHTLAYGDAVPTVTPIYTGLQYSESATQGLTTLPTCTTAYARTTNVGTTPTTTCSGAASVKYDIAYEAGAVTIGKRMVTVTASTHTVSYGDPVPTVAFTLANMANSQTRTALSPEPTCTTTYTQGSLPSAPHTTSCSGAGSGNYDFTYVGGTVTTSARIVTVTASNETRTYGDPSIPAPTPTYTGWAPGEGTGLLTSEASCTTTYTHTSTVAAGAATSCSGAAAPNYAFTYVNGRVTVARRQVTITASDGTTTYGTTAPAITPIYGSEFVNGDTSSVVSGTSCTSAWAATTPTTSTPRSYCQSATAANYSFRYVDGVVTVTRKPITAIAQTRSIVYGSAVPVITVSYTGMVNGDTGTSALSPQPTCATDYQPTDRVGTPRTTTCTGGAGTNYDITAYTGGTITITKRTITVTASSHLVTYGDPRPTITPASYTGWVNGESESTVAITGITCSATGYQPTTSVTTTPATSCTGGTADDYSFSHVNGAITIQKQGLTVTASSPAVEYGDAIPAVSPSYDGWVNGEGTGALSPQVRCRTAYTPTTAVAATTAERLTECWGAGAVNYEITYVPGAVAVSRAPVEITASGPTVTYGDVIRTVRTAPSVTATPLPASGTVTLTAVDGAWTGSPGETATRQWQQSTDGGATWADIAGQTGATYAPTTTVLNAGTTAFRVQVTWADGSDSLVAVSDGLAYRRMVYNGSYQTWTAPAGVTRARFDLVGARGGQRGYGSGGLGGRAAATFGVTPGSTYYLYVGATTSSTTGGFNGGGNGYGTGAGGGGATDLRTSTSTATRLLVAGGGGGDGGTNGGTPYGNHGGGGGGTVALPGTTKVAPNSTYVGGGGGSNAAGGAPGSYGSACGGTGSTTSGGAACTSGSGGGGGGGYYGGGGAQYGGGGGGASWAAGTATDVQHRQVYPDATGNGFALVSYRVAEAATVSGAAALVQPVYTLRNGEGPSALTTQPTCTTGYTFETAVAAPSANRVTSCSGAAADNYSFTYATGTVTVERKEVVVQASSPNVTYGDPVPAVTAAYAGWVNGQGTEVLSPAATCSTTYEVGTSVATGAPTSCAGADAANYRFAYRAGTVAVARKGAVITASDVTVTYGDPVPTITPAYSGLVAGDTDAVVTTLPSCSTAYTVLSDYGTSPATTCTGGAAANYTFTHEGGRVTILKREIIVQASSPIVAYGANVPTITAAYSGWVNGQGPSVMGADTAVCESTYRVTDGITVVPVSSCSGADALNYRFTYRSGTVTITRKNVDVTASDHTATYGDPSIATPTPSYAGWVNGEGPGVLTTVPTCSTTYTASSSVAAGATTVCTGAAAANYSFTAIPGRVTVERKELTVTASSPTVEYGAPTPAVSASYAGFVNAQNASVVSATTCGTVYTVFDVVGATPATTCANATAANYSFAYVSGSVTIVKRQVTVVADSPVVYYGAAKPVIGFTLQNMANGETSAVLAVQPTCDTAYTPSDLTSTTPRTWCENADDENYRFVYTDGAVTIQPAIITVTASSDTRVYGDASVPTITPSFTGWVNGQDDSLLTTRPTCQTNYSNLSTVAGDARTWCAGAVGGQYTFAYVDGTVDVTRKGVVVTASSENAVYGDASVTVTPSYSGFVNGQTQVGIVSGIACSSTFTPTSAVGTTPTTACSGATAANYSFTYQPGSVTIAQRELTVTAPSPVITYGDPTPDTTPDLDGFANNQTDAVFDTLPECTTPHTQQTDVAAPLADRTITCSGASALNYRFTYVPGTITVNRKTLVMSGLSATSRDYDGSRDVAITGTPVLMGIESWDAVTPVGAPVGTADQKHQGSRTVTVSGVVPSAGDGDNYQIQTLTLSAAISRKALTIAGYSATTRAYTRAAAFAIAGTGSLVGVVSPDVVSLTGSPTGASTDGVDVGPHQVAVSGVSLTGAGASNYTLSLPTLPGTITEKELTISGWSAPTRAYNGSDAVALAGTPSLVGIISPDAVTLDGTAVATAASEDIGTRAVTIAGMSLGGASAPNYRLTLPALTIAITAKQLTLTGLSATSRDYDGTRDVQITGTPGLSGVVGVEDVAPSGTPVGTAATKHQGAQTVTVSGVTLTGPDVGNYALTTLTLPATISRKALTITGYSATTRQYTRAAAFAIAGTPSLVGVISPDVVSVTGSPTGASTDGVEVGPHQVAVSGVSLTGAGASNYTLTLPTVTGTIIRKDLTVSGLSATGRQYDAGRDIAITGTPSLVGVIAGDTVAVTGTPVGTADQAGIGPRSVTVTGLSLTGASEPNYALPDPVLSATIARKEITIAGLSPTGRDYNRQTGIAVTGTPSLVGVEAGDVVTVSGTPTGTAASRDAGSRGVTVAGYTLGGAGAGNYTLVHPSLTVSIERKPLTVSGISAPTRAYNRSDAVALSGTGALGGIESGDTVTLTGTATGLADSDDAGTRSVTVSGLALGGASAANYRLPAITVPLTITRKTLTISGVSATTRYYDGSTDVELTGTPALVGVISGDAVQVTGTGTGSVTGAGIGTRTVTVTGYGLTGADEGNYAVSQPAPSVTIQRAPVTVRASSPSVTYGDPVPAVAPAYDGFVDGEGTGVLTQVPTCTTDYTTASGAGSAPQTRCSGTAAANYSFTHQPGAVLIAQKGLAVTASSAIVEHGAPVPTVTASYDGLVNGDQPSVVTGQTCSTTYTTSTPAGQTRPATCAGGAAANYAVAYTAGTVTVVQSDVTIAWTAPADITYETPITTAQLNASAADDYGPVGGKGALVYTIGGQPLAEGDVLGAGSHTLSVSFVPRAEEAGNYAGATRSVTLVVHKAPQSLVAGAAATSRIYGQGTTLHAGSHSGTGAITYQVVSGPCQVTGATLETTGAGTCSVRASIATDANYLPQTSTAITIAVARKTLVVTPVDQQRRRGSADPALTHLVTGFVRTDAEADLDQPIALVRDPGEEPGTYAIRASGASDADYDFDYRLGTFTIIERDAPVLAWPAPDPITYGDLLSATELDPTAVFGGADVAGSWTYATAAGPVAVGTQLPAGSHVVTGTFTPANTVDYQSGLTRQTLVTVRPKPLAVVGATAADRDFDETTTADVDLAQAQLVGIVGADDVRLVTDDAVGAFATAEAGEAREVRISGLALDGADADNYALVQPTATATISAVAPGPPTAAAASAGDRSATVEWDAPAFGGGAPITAYTVTASPGGQTCTWTSGPLRCTVEGLLNGTGYTFTVRAANRAGTGEPSGPSTTVTPAVPMLATLGTALAEGGEVAADGTVTLGIGCAPTAKSCSVKVSMYLGRELVAKGGTGAGSGGEGGVVLRLPPAYQAQLAREGRLVVRLVIEFEVDGSVVRLESTTLLEAPAAPTLVDPALKPTSTGSTDFGAGCRGARVERCDGVLSLYAEPLTVQPNARAKADRVLLATRDFGAAAGSDVNALARLTPQGRAFVERHGTVRVVPVLTLRGKTKIKGRLPRPYAMTMLTPEQWLRRAVGTLSVGGRPRLDLNLLLDAHRAGRVSDAEAARRIAREIIPRRERALRRVEALPIPPRELRPIVTLLERSFAQSLAANHAYVRWLRSGVAHDDVAWRHSARATQTKKQLIERLNKAGRRYGVRVPAPTGLWP